MMFTLEIAGRAIAITDADASHARKLFGSDDFKDDLRSTESEGRPLWDGSAPFNIRASSSEEIEAFDDALNDDEEDGPAANEDEGDEDEGGINVVFLVPVDEMDGAPGATH